MRISTRRFLHDIVAEVLGLDGGKVIWSNQDGVKQLAPFVTLMAYSHRAEAMEELRPTDVPGVFDLKTPTAFTLEVRYFGKKNSYPVDILDDFVRHMAKPTIVDKCFVNGVAFLYADAVQDITATLMNNQQFEPAAAVDFHCRFTASVADEPGYVDTVDIRSEYDPTPEPGPEPIPGPDPTPTPEPTPVTKGGWLIYGNIKDGKVTDLDHAIPVDIYATVKEEED